MAGGAPQGGQSDNSTGILWSVAAIFLGLGMVWYLFKVPLVKAYLTIKLYEINLIAAIHNTPYLQEAQYAISRALLQPGNVDFNFLYAAGAASGDWLRFPFAILLVVLGILLYFWNTVRMFKNNYDMKALANFEKVNWPQITPVTKLNLIKTDIDTGPWAMALTPMQYCKRFKLLEEVRPVRRDALMRDRDRVEVVLKRGEANQLFALQLGPLWQGPDKLPIYMKALFAAFAARVNADAPGAAKLLGHIAASSATKLDFTGTEELLKKHVNTKIVQKVINSHAYVMTEMAAMIERARDDGVQASADFLWLKPVDRRLWYTLNTVGRQTPFVEVAGIFAHWTAEKAIGRKLLVPMVDEATKALETALKEVIYKPDETP